MCREVGPRQVLMSILAQGDWSEKPLTELIEHVCSVTKQLREKDVQVSCTVHHAGVLSYWSDDVTWEIGFLSSAGWLRLRHDIVEKTAANYKSLLGFACEDLDEDVRSTLYACAK